MKGPGLRVDHDVRRLWVCPDCSRSLRLDGSVSYMRCDCQGATSSWMQLIESAPVIPRSDRECSADDDLAGGGPDTETGDWQ